MKTRGRNIAERADVTGKFVGDESFNLSLLPLLQLIHDAIFLRRWAEERGVSSQKVEKLNFMLQLVTDMTKRETRHTKKSFAID